MVSSFNATNSFHTLAAPVVHASGAGQFLGVDWGSFVLVAVVSFAAAVVIVVFYSLGLRLLSIGSRDDTEQSDGAIVSTAHGQRPLGATVGGYVCLAIGIAAVLYSIYLIIPQLH